MDSCGFRFYLALLEQKTNAIDQAAPLSGWKLPEGFHELRRLWKRAWARRANASV
jgi:hypothetical protein